MKDLECSHFPFHTFAKYFILSFWKFLNTKKISKVAYHVSQSRIFIRQKGAMILISAACSKMMENTLE